ncbi:MAG: mechanosensitive ion channel [Thiotrichales bacterium]|nr:mechanosensitive ion channel [Thiotrichales bacterium]
MVNFQSLQQQGQAWVEQAVFWAQSPNFYYQALAIACAVVFAWFLAKALKNKWFDDALTDDSMGAKALILKTKNSFVQILFPIISLFALSIFAGLLMAMDEANGLLKVAQSWAVIVLIFYIIKHFVSNVFIGSMLKWVGIPLATLSIFGLLSPTIAFLESIAFDVGDIHVSLYAVLRLLVFGSVLFWLGAWSNRYGQLVIRNKETLDIRTREVFAKLFQIALFLVIFLLLLQGVGIDLTALAVFGGALGVGIGFGLQQIASNFISGMIILLDKSMAIGNYIEMEDGKSGTLKRLDMRSSSLETFDGKMLVVPNEKFITSTFINWTHEDPRQRYSLTFSVAYDSDIPSIPALILDAVKQHPQVLMEPELPDCEIIEFADSGVVFQLEYWIHGIDDGRNRVGSDLFMIIWQTLHDNNIAIPFPQREVRILKD